MPIVSAHFRSLLKTQSVLWLWSGVRGEGVRCSVIVIYGGRRVRRGGKGPGFVRVGTAVRSSAGPTSHYVGGRRRSLCTRKYFFSSNACNNRLSSGKPRERCTPPATGRAKSSRRKIINLRSRRIISLPSVL